MRYILTRGLPASGKTTWTKWMQEGNPGLVRINLDDLGTSMFGKVRFDNGNLGILLHVQEKAIRMSLSAGRDVIVDNTNLNPNTVSKLVSIGLDYRVNAEIVDFKTPIQECIYRNSFREGAAFVPNHVIIDMNRRFAHES